MSYFDQDSKAMLDVYLLETRQLIEKLDTILLDAEKNNNLDSEDINSIFRIMHTIKSSSAMMSLEGLSEVAHSLEDLFAELRDGNGTLGQDKKELFEMLFEVSDFIKSEALCMKEDSYNPADVTGIEERINTCLLEENKKEKAAQETLEKNFLEQTGAIFRVTFEPECRMENIRAFMLMRRLRGSCPEAECIPEKLENNLEAAEYIKQHGLLVKVACENRKEAFEVMSSGIFIKSCELIAKRSENESVQNKVENRQAKVQAESEFMDIRVERLDELQYLAGELTVLMASLTNELEEKGDADLNERYGHPAKQLVEEFGNTVLNMRMVPIGRIIPKLKRVLRNISKDQNKEVDFIVTGQETEADKNIVDQLYEASMHIIRNAVDHGIEESEERKKQGKPEKGCIKFIVESSGGEMVVRISDDGRGLDVEKLKEKARQKQLLTKPEEEYTDEEIYEFCTLPGFTTNQEANKYSGRGVGMDIVKKITEDAGGHLRIESEKGKGTELIIYLPITHTIIEGTVFSAGGHLFSVPFRQTVRFFEYSEADRNIKREQGRMVFVYEDKVLPVIDISAVFGMAQPEEKRDRIMLYVRGPVMEACILVDEVIGSEKIVMKLLPRLLGADFRALTGMSACSVMGDGRICMALDVEVFIQAVLKREERGESNGR